MPGKSWKDLNRHKKTANNSQTNSHENVLRGSSGVINSRNSGINKSNAMEQAKQSSPRLSRLLKERKALENRLRHLTSGSDSGLQTDPRNTARFQVLSFAERRAQQQEWESRREKYQQQSTHIRKQIRQTRNRQTRTATSPRSPSSLNSVNQWLARRDSQRQSMREAARDRLSPLTDVARMGKKIGGSLSNASRQLRDLDRQLAEQGMDQERNEIRRMGGSQLAKTRSTVNKYTKMAEAPMRAVNKIDNFWKKRQEKISGAMDKAGPYVNRSRERLSTERGGSGDLFERMECNRKRALQRQKEKRDEEARDEARRKRARQNKRKREKEY